MWYHGRMSRRDAENLLGRDGDFLVRDSATNPGQYVLTGMQCGLPKHLLLVDPEGVVSDTLGSLLGWFYTNQTFDHQTNYENTLKPHQFTFSLYELFIFFFH